MQRTFVKLNVAGEWRGENSTITTKKRRNRHYVNGRTDLKINVEAL